MGSTPRSLWVAACLGAGVWMSAQPLAQQASFSATRPHAVGELLPGLPGRFWSALLADAGHLPDHERLVVLATDGRVLTVVDGRDDAVDIPASLDAWLDNGTAWLVLAHNHPADTSLSGADLALLGRAGVERVVALGHDGSVFEAAAGPRYGGRAATARIYLDVEARLKAHLAGDAVLAGVTPESVFPLFSHLVDSVLGRIGVIDYRCRLSVSQLALVTANASWLDRLVTSEAARLSTPPGR